MGECLELLFVNGTFSEKREDFFRFGGTGKLKEESLRRNVDWDQTKSL